MENEDPIRNVIAMRGAALLVCLGALTALAAPDPSPDADTAARPSFDCAKAAGKVERYICSDAAIARLDRAIARAYAKGMAKESPWTRGDRALQRTAQRTWIADRNACARRKDTEPCVADSYHRRLAELRILNDEVGHAIRAEYLCKESSTHVSAAYYSDVDPHAALIAVGARRVVAFVAASGSGARYTTRNVELWEHQGLATLQWYGARYQCTVEAR
jgi:uncharacterized protein